MEDVVRLSALELLEAYRKRRLSPVELIDALAERIGELNPRLGAFTTLCLDRARIEATACEKRYRRSEPRGPLDGVPIGVKDLFDSGKVRTTYGSPMFDNHIPDVDAVALHRAREAGGILIGKTQTHEFAWGITSVNPLMGTSRNPWDPERMSGGSSGGSAVALAAHLVPIALGSDTGGSIRIPSAFCGTVGVKPTYGRVSAAGVFPLARSLDHPGPMARTPADAALLLGVIAGPDPGDPATAQAPAELCSMADNGLTGVRVGLCSHLPRVPLAPDIQAPFNDAAKAAQRLGAELVEVDVPGLDKSYETFGTVQRAEALFTHRNAGLFPGRSEEYGDDVRGRLELASQALPSHYLSASDARQRLRTAFEQVFTKVDMLLTPVSACSPLPIEHERTVHLDRELTFRELAMSYTVPQDLTGLPACALRAGFDRFGMPVGVQLTGPLWSEARVLGAAQALFAGTEAVQAPWPSMSPSAPQIAGQL